MKLLRNHAVRKEEGKPFAKEAAMAKWYSSVIAQKTAGSAIEWAGGIGFTRETGIEKFWRDSKIVSNRDPYPTLSDSSIRVLSMRGHRTSSLIR